jgi:hypothetical protein
MNSVVDECRSGQDTDGGKINYVQKTTCPIVKKERDKWPLTTHQYNYMFRPHEVVIGPALEYFEKIYKLHLLERRYLSLHNTVIIYANIYMVFCKKQ